MLRPVVRLADTPIPILQMFSPGLKGLASHTCTTQDLLGHIRIFKILQKKKRNLVFGLLDAQDRFNHGHKVTARLLREVTDRQNIPFVVHALFLLFGDRKKKECS